MANRDVHSPEVLEPYARRLACNLRSLRDGLGMTQEAVAELADISPYTYQKFEKGESKPGTPANPTLQTLISLAAALHVTVSVLVSVDFDAAIDYDSIRRCITANADWIMSDAEDIGNATQLAGELDRGARPSEVFAEYDSSSSHAERNALKAAKRRIRKRSCKPTIEE